MSSTILFAAGLLVGAAQAYTQVNAASPFMLKNIDPIVFPGQHGKSHLHSFFGSDAVTVDTKTSAELQKGCTNAENPNDFTSLFPSCASVPTTTLARHLPRLPSLRT
ncbi:hypothetical protein NXS19_002152 [Fusarium pseudograminearum]|nr:hypothetical protein NXS19_002152 [Fusarium pseudograminearum]